MLYTIVFANMPIHPRYDHHRQEFIGLGPSWWSLRYEPTFDVAKVTIVAETVAGARIGLACFYGPPVACLPTRWLGEHPGAPPPPDWPATVCPECKGTGRVLLFVGYSPCNTCGGGRCPSS